MEIIGCPILITADREAKTIDVAVAGDGHRREALAVVRSLFEAVHKRLPEADPKERVPLPDNPVSDVGYQHLLEIVNKDSPDEMIRPEGWQVPGGRPPIRSAQRGSQQPGRSQRARPGYQH